ncbi:hypothetical protein [Legionella fallonii]|nr:hypothetical protein [Legionella fallonii]
MTALGFVEHGKNYVVCNQPHLIKEDATMLHRLFVSIPLEYPHEIVNSL